MKRFLPLVLLCAVSATASAQSTIRIGELNSYKAFPAFLEPYRKLDAGDRGDSMPPGA